LWTWLKDHVEWAVTTLGAAAIAATAGWFRMKQSVVSCQARIQELEDWRGDQERRHADLTERFYKLSGRVDSATED